MRALINLKTLTAGAVALALGGCLVSEVAVLDDASGRAKPLRDGVYVACPVAHDSDGSDCDTLTVAYQSDKSYHFLGEDEEPSVLRFRRVGRHGYAVQSQEDDDEFAYYYGAGDSRRMTLTMMICQDLPEDLRSRLISDGDLSSDSEDFETCSVNTVRGLVDAAKAYHRDQAPSDEPIVMEIKPAPQE